jgi:hypothetical protein
MTTALLYPYHSIGAQPVVGVNNIEFSDKILDLEEPVNESPAHIIDVIYKIAVLRVETPVIMDPVDTVVGKLPLQTTCKNVDLMTFCRNRRRKFTYMDGHAPHCY